MNKMHESFRLSAECRELLSQTAKRLGVSKAAVIEMAVREFAEPRKAVTNALK